MRDDRGICSTSHSPQRVLLALDGLDIYRHFMNGLENFYNI